MKLKFAILLIYLTLSFSFCNSQTRESLKTGKIKLEKIIFHSSRCNGICPRIDLIIDSNKNIFANREIYISKSEVYRRYSGQFEGTLQQTDYNKLITLLETCNLDSLKFPSIDCCDGIITTIIVYYNGQRKYLRSMTPPQIADKLIWFLNSVGFNKKLKRTNEIKSIEE
jgi:hypothetical protein